MSELTAGIGWKAEWRVCAGDSPKPAFCGVADDVCLRLIADIRRSTRCMAMRSVTLLSILALGACGTAPSNGEPEQIEIAHASVWGGVRVVLTGDGSGRVYRGDTADQFDLAPDQFADFVERLKPFQEQSVAATEITISKMLDSRCPAGVPMINDAGIVTVTWVGGGLERVYFASLECDVERLAARNRRLLSILYNLLGLQASRSQF